MHCPKGVLKASMFCGGKYPSSALELEDASKTLNPGGVDYVSFRFLPFHTVCHYDIVVNGVCDQSDSLDFFHFFVFLKGDPQLSEALRNPPSSVATSRLGPSLKGNKCLSLRSIEGKEFSSPWKGEAWKNLRPFLQIARLIRQTYSL